MPLTNLRARRHYRWLVRSLFMAVAGGTILVQFSVGAALPDMSQEFRLSSAQEGLLGASFWIGSVVLLVPLTGWMSRRRPVRLQTAIGVQSVLLMLLMAWAPTYEWLLLARVLFVVAWVSQIPIGTALIHDWFEGGEFVKVNAVSTAIFAAIEVGAIAGTAPLIDLLDGWRGAMLVYAALTAIATALWALLVREHPGSSTRISTPERGGSLSRALRYRETWLSCMVAFGSAAIFSAFLTFWPSYASEDLGISLALASGIFAIGSIAVVMASLSSSVLSRHLSHRFLIWFPLAWAGPLFFAMLLTDRIPVLAFFSFTQGLTAVSFPILLTVPFRIGGIQSREVALVAAIAATALNASGAFGPAFTGVVAEITGSTHLALGLVCLFPVVGVAGGLMLPSRSPTPPQAFHD